MKNRKRMPMMAVAAVALGSILMLTSCETGSDDPAKVQKIASIIQSGTATATSIGLVAVPDSVEADQIARELRDILGESVLPILGGNEEGLATGLGKLLTLDFLNNPKYAKAKAILESAMPLLEANLPADLLDKPLTQVPADVKAYVTAFFTGVHQGASAYLGDRDMDNRWLALRQKLAQ